MKRTSLMFLALLALPALRLTAAMIELQPGQMGYYWYERSTWLGGSDTTTGFAYGDGSGLQHVQRNYQYYGGSDRYWQQKDLYVQIDLTAITQPLDGPATFHFYVTQNTSPAESFLKHLTTQSTAPTGDAGQKLAGDVNVTGTGSFTVGWNSVDVTSYIQSDLDNSYGYAVFSIPQFGQVQDENRVLSIYGPSSTVEIGGNPTRPFLEFTVIPEPVCVFLIVEALLLIVMMKRRLRGA